MRSPNGSRFAILLACSLLLGAAQPWREDPGRWTVEDARHIVLDSPWAQPGTALFGKPLSPEDIAPAPLPGAAESGIAGPEPHTGAGWDGGPGRDTASRTPTLPIVVRWDSALPVREAFKKLPAGDRMPGDEYTAAQAETHYILTLSGLVPAGRYAGQGQIEKHSSSEENPTGKDLQDPEQLLEEVMQTSRLMPRDASPIRPDDVKLDASTGTLHLFFPRGSGLSANTREVVFSTEFGSMRVSQRFRLKEMRFEGHLAL